MKYYISENNLILDFKEDDEDKIIKKTRKLIKECDKNNYNLIFRINGKRITKKYINLYNIQKAINIRDIKERYSFIYDTVCDYIDKKYSDCNYCDFKNNICVFFRNHPEISHIDGCCYSDARGGTCKYLKNHKCEIKSISCKLYFCEYLRKNKINFKMKSIPLIKYFFNVKQKYFIKYSFFKPKPYVIYKLITNKKL